MSWLFADPKLFNYLIMGLYVTNSIWWAWHKSWGVLRTGSPRSRSLRP